MTIKEIKNNLYNLIDESNDFELLKMIYQIFLSHSSKENFFDAFTEEQKKDLEQAFEEIKHDENLISHDIVKEQMVNYLTGKDSLRKRINKVVKVDKDFLHGTPVFKGTRVPIKNLFDYLKGGHDIDTFLIDFPRVKKEQIENVLKIAKDYLMEKRFR